MYGVQMRKGVIETYLAIIALAIVMLIGITLALRSKPLQISKPLIRFETPNISSFCKKQLASFKLVISNPYNSNMYVNLKLSSNTNISSISVLPSDIVIVPPKSLTKVNMIINTSVPDGLYKFGYTIYAYLPTNNGIKIVGTKNVNGTLKIVDCVNIMSSRNFEGEQS